MQKKSVFTVLHKSAGATKVELLTAVTVLTILLLAIIPLLWRDEPHTAVLGSQSSTAPEAYYDLASAEPARKIAVRDDIWPSQEDFPSPLYLYGIPAGAVFSHADGHCYVSTRDIFITKMQASAGPSVIQGWANLLCLSGKIYHPASFNPANAAVLAPGDLFYDQAGNYYLYTGPDGAAAALPSENPAHWYLLPSEAADS